MLDSNTAKRVREFEEEALRCANPLLGNDLERALKLLTEARRLLTDRSIATVELTLVRATVYLWHGHLDHASRLLDKAEKDAHQHLYAPLLLVSIVEQRRNLQQATNRVPLAA